MKIVIAGYYGKRNLGDEAILAAMVSDIQAAYPACDLVVVSWDPALTEQSLNVRSVSVGDVERQVQEVSGCDLAVLGGGGLFQDHYCLRISNFFKDTISGVPGYARIPLMAKMLGRKVLYFAHGLGPLFSKEAFDFSRWALSLADRMTVRDEYSYYLATTLLQMPLSRIDLGYDPALKLPLQSQERIRSILERHRLLNRRILLVAPRPWKPPAVFDCVMECLTRAIWRFLESHDDYAAVFLPFQTGSGFEDDVAVCHRIMDGLPKDSVRLVDLGTDWKDALALFQAADLCLGIRYHSLLFALRSATPAVGLLYDKKNEDLLREWGLASYGLAFHEVKETDLHALLEKARREKASIEDHLREKYLELLRNRRDSITVLQEMMENAHE